MYPNHQGKYDVLGIMYTHKSPCSFVMDKRKSHTILVREFCDLVQAKRLEKDNPRQGITIINQVAKEVFEKIFTDDIDPEKYVEEHGLKTVSDEGALRSVVEAVITANPQSVADYKGGKEKAIGFLVGQTMKAMKGKADPGAVNKMLKEILSR